MEVSDAVREISTRIMKDRFGQPPHLTLPQWEEFLHTIIADVERTALDRGAQYDER